MTSHNRRIRVGVVFGGRSGEHDVSLRSAQTVIGALEASGHEVIPIGITREGAWLTDGDPMQSLQSASPLFALTDGGEREEGEVLASVTALSIKANQSSAPAVIPASGWAGELDVIFPVLHGPMGEDGTVQGMLELTGVPFIGCGVLSSALAMDKTKAKEVFAANGIPQVAWSSFHER
ncbi:MAG TPA: hypothetical protein VEX37_10910, partial [Thermomicrobiales bacterium]|nr:hypothetical protein [Thermomicrobiales bacterium]